MQASFADWTWERQCEFTAKTGYTGIEVAPFTLADRAENVTPQQRAELKAVAEANGLEIIGLHWLLAKTTGFHLTTADSAVRKRTADYFIELGNLCADLGGSLMVLGSPQQRNLEPGVTKEQATASGIDHNLPRNHAALSRQR